MSTPSPGSITVSKDAVHNHIPGLKEKILAHIEAWALSVPEGTTVTVAKMLCCGPTCGCPEDGQLTTCEGKNHGLPVEIVLDLLFPEDGVCDVEDVQAVYSIPRKVKKASYRGCHGCGGTCCTGWGSEPCTC